MPKIELIVEEELDSRLDAYLADNTLLSRSLIQKLIKDQRVLVNGNKSRNSYRIQPDDQIEIDYEEESQSDLKPADIPLQIVYEDDDVIVINKQRGLVVHPAPGNYDNTLVNALLFRNQELSDLNGYYRPGIVHRIDKVTSGLLVVCKNNIAHMFIAEQLQDKSCFRKYYAIVKGVVPNDEASIDAPIGRNPKNRQKMCVTDKNSKSALTDFTVLERFSDSSFLDVNLHTGRTHQIRVHLAFIHHPVLNDGLYGKADIDESGQYLHAYYLSFIHPRTKERVEFKTEIPEYMKEYLQAKGSKYGR